MAGYTDQAMRKVCRHFGGGLYYTEVAVAQGLIRDSAPSWHLLACDADEQPVAAHIYGSDPAAMAEAARMIEASGRFAAIDINCGCPVKKIVAKGAGAALIKDPARIEAIVRAVRQAVALPVLVKTRIGYEADKLRIMEIAARVACAGASALAIHGRFAAHHHKGPANWEVIAEVKQRAGIPIIGNGGIKTAEQAVEALQTYGLDGVMIARGAVGNPWILADAETLFGGGSVLLHDYSELRRVIHLHIQELIVLKTKEALWRRRPVPDPDQAAALQFRCHLLQYLAGLENWVDIRRCFSQITSCSQIYEMVDVVIARQTRPWHVLYHYRG
ncbi:MAG: tRNA dihydrouridine synthase [Kiritimatiellia bacterium]